MRYFFSYLLFFYFFSCTPNNVNIDESLEKHFKNNKVEGCFALFDNGTGKFTVYNLARYRDSAFLPASTFKIINSLIGLQTGKIVNDSMVIKWDGIDRGRKECNRDMSMYDAFRISCPPWYQELVRRIGKDTMQNFLDTLFEGTEKIKVLDTFWLDNSLKLRPDQQLGIVTKLYFNQLPFHKINQEIVKRAMLFEDNTEYKLSYKTGWGQNERGAHLAWLVGWIEENRHPYFFVLNFETADPNADIPTIRLEMLKAILKQLGFMQGRR